VLYAGMLLLSVASLLPASDISWSSSGQLGSSARKPTYLVRAATNMIAAPWWPISPSFPRHFWETDALVQKSLLVLAPLVLLAYWRVLKRDTNLLVTMGLVLIFGTLFADIVYVGRVRHWGISFIAFLLCLWMRNAGRQRQGVQRPDTWPLSAYALMTLSAVAGIIAVGSSWTRPFSQARATADWIKQNEPRDVTLLGAPDVSFASVSEEMERPVYFLECYCTGTFKLFSNGREDFQDKDLGNRLSLAMSRLHVSSLVFVFWRPFLSEDLQGLKAHALSASPLKEFAGAESYFENHYIYQIRRYGGPEAPAEKRSR
jgi:hypothetical protein